MIPEQLKQEILKYKWEYWADRRFGAFIMSLFRGANNEYYKKIVDLDIVWPAALFQKQAFYKSEEVWDLFEKEYLERNISNEFPLKVVKLCEKYQKEGRLEINNLVISSKPLLQKFERLVEILRKTIPFVWMAHGMEHVYRKRMEKEAPKYFKGDVVKFIGDISFPVKKNEHNYLEEALSSEMDIKDVQKKYAWIKVRDGFSEGYSVEELEEARSKAKKDHLKEERFVRPEIPKELESLAKITQSLVYLRTLRTDVLYELMYLGRPILKEVAEHYNIPFDDLRHYDTLDLINGNSVKHNNDVCIVEVKGEFAIFDYPIYEEDKYENVKELKGAIAFKGKITGKVKVVITAYEIGKVNEGDILVAPTTAPSYIIGMKKAGAFVTDEGGITSHAAIVAREMKKPCIIGTKIATKVLKDGNLVEVNAEKGTVTILN